jgi:hypothetical protein
VVCVALAWLAPIPAIGSEVDGIEPAPSQRQEHPHVLYGELLGKGGLYTVGYDYAFADRFAVGGGFAYYSLDGERVLSLSPYVSWYPVAGVSSALLLQTGLQFAHVSVPSEVPGWRGATTTGVGGQFSAGYELRHGFVFRFLLSGFVGKGGVRPWVGIELGGAR